MNEENQKNVDILKAVLKQMEGGTTPAPAPAPTPAPAPAPEQTEVMQAFAKVLEQMKTSPTPIPTPAPETQSTGISSEEVKKMLAEIMGQGKTKEQNDEQYYNRLLNGDQDTQVPRENADDESTRRLLMEKDKEINDLRSKLTQNNKEEKEMGEDLTDQDKYKTMIEQIQKALQEQKTKENNPLNNAEDYSATTEQSQVIDKFNKLSSAGRDDQALDSLADGLAEMLVGGK